MQAEVYVTGIGIVSPLGLDTQSTWSSLIKGKSGINTIRSFDTTDFSTTIAGEIPDFDPLNYLDRKQARRMDRFSQLATAATTEALLQAKLEMPKDGNNVAVIIGSGVGGIITISNQYDILRDQGPQRVNPFFLPMMLADMAPGQLSMIFGTTGPNFTAVSSCSSGADAIGTAAALIRQGDVELAIAGGTEAPICPIAVAGFNACQALSRRNHEPELASRPFDAGRDGFVMSEGSAILVLESAKSVAKRKAYPLAVISGYGATSDAYHVTQPDPEGKGAIQAMTTALQKASTTPELIDYVNAHGTSTPLNDRLETMALKQVFKTHAQSLTISSTKSMTGHLLGATGALEAAICVQVLQTGMVPPTINLSHSDPDCDLDYVPNTYRSKQVKTAMSNSLGFGGHNSSLIFKSID